MSWQKIIGAILVCGGLVAFLTYDARRKEQKQEAEEKQSLVIGEAFKWNELASLSIATKRTQLEFEVDPQATKGDQGPETWRWVISKPFATEAENNDVQNYLRTLRDIKSKEVIEEAAQELTPFGLDDNDQPMRLRLTLKDGSSKELLIGDLNPGKSENYARFADSRKVMLIEQRLNYLAAKDFDFFRRKTLFDFDNQTVTRLVHRWQGQAEIDVRQENADWRLHKPFTAAGDNGRISGILAEIKNARIDKYPSEKADAEAVKWGLAKPRGEIEIYLKDRKEPLKLAIGADNAAKGGFYLRKSGSPTVYELQNFHLDKLKKRVGDFIEHGLGRGMDANLVNQLTVLMSNAAGTQEQQRLKLLPNGFWQLEQNNKLHQASGEKMQVLLQKLMEMVGREYVGRTPEPTQGLNKPKLQIIAQQPGPAAADKPKEFRFVFSAPREKLPDVFVRGGPDQFIFDIDKSVLAMLQESVAKLRDGYVVPAQPVYDKVSMQIGADPKRLVEMENGAKGWQVKSQKGFSLPVNSKADDLIKALESLDIVRFLESGQASAHQADKERDLTLRFTYLPLAGEPGGARPAERQVRLGFTPFGEGYYVQVDPGAPFSAYEAVISKFTAEELLKKLGLFVGGAK